jgi:hypothetical protein
VQDVSRTPPQHQNPFAQVNRFWCRIPRKMHSRSWRCLDTEGTGGAILPPGPDGLRRFAGNQLPGQERKQSGLIISRSGASVNGYAIRSLHKGSHRSSCRCVKSSPRKRMVRPAKSPHFPL